MVGVVVIEISANSAVPATARVCPIEATVQPAGTFCEKKNSRMVCGREMNTGSRTVAPGSMETIHVDDEVQLFVPCSLGGNQRGPWRVAGLPSR
jgi:hypothetical protein